MANIKLDGYRCERCDHVWVPRETTEGQPTICPDCKSPYWNKPRQTAKTRKRAIITHFRKKRGKNERT